MLDFAKLARQNADLRRWVWRKQDKRKWEEAPPDIQEFYQKWRNHTTEPESKVTIGPMSRFGRIPEAFLVRESYKSMLDRIWKRAFGKPNTGVVVTGQPGVGKTYFLWYALIRLIQQQQPVAIAIDNDIYLFYGDHVWFQDAETRSVRFPDDGRMVKSAEELRPFVFVLIDHDAATSEPNPKLHSNWGVFAIQAASPNPRQFRTWAKMRKAALWGLPLWEEDELNAALCLQPEYHNFRTSLEPLLPDFGESEDLDLDLEAALDVLAQWMKKAVCFHQKHKDSGEASTGIEEEDQNFQVNMMTVDGALRVLVHAAVQHFGGIARDVFEAVFSRASADSAQANALAHVTLEQIEEFSNTLVHEDFFPEQAILHHIIAVEPVVLAADESEFAYQLPKDKWMIHFRTEWIACQINKKFLELDGEEQERFFRCLLQFAETHSLAGQLLKPTTAPV